ncbi:hypothetical protein PVAND_011802 [Polypedilum vanderplanki]|uniref:Plekhh1 n=1 Tax=Polypedilum vanderplanki TaxID=319348 RepID=A0A9J6CLC6_POLVA|nr:hypothetical protein PVAND_011802 [Polypedilum vanderplanki]
MEQKLNSNNEYQNLKHDLTNEKISQLESKIEEQKQLRLQDAKQVELKAARIKEWVTNKLRDLEFQNQQLREQNVKCNQQLDLLKKHIASHNNNSRYNTHSARHSVRSSLSLSSSDYRNRGEHRRSESLDTQFSKTHFLTSSHSPNHQQHNNLPHYYIRRSQKYTTMDPQDVINNFTVEGLNLITSSANSHNSMTHDYAEIYTPSIEKKPLDSWSKTLPSCCSSSPTSTSAEYMTAKPPTPPLHRFPSWEAKIYEVANDGLAGEDSDSQEQDLSSTNVDSLPRVQATLSGCYGDINIPVYATVKGRASQIRSIPFSGESSDDDSSDGADENVNVASIPCTQFNNSHNSTCTDNTESSSPSKSLKTSSSLSPAKHQSAESDSPLTKNKEVLFEPNETMDYALPPDAVSNDPLALSIHASLPAMMRASYIDSPNKKSELEKSGHLVKLGGKLKTWRKRWFVLKNGTLMYWKSQHDINKKPQGEIALDDTCRITHAEGASTFEINTNKRTYYLTADSNALMDDWVKVLQNVQKRNVAKLLLSKDDQKPTVEGWLTKVKNGHAKRCWCILLGKMFLYFKTPHDTNPLGQINMRDTRVEEMSSSDSDSEENDEQSQNTIAIHPQQSGPTYLIFSDKSERDNWLYHLTIVSGGGLNSGTQFEQIVQKLMEADGDANSVLWRHPILLYSKENLTTPLTSLHSEELQNEALKLFKSCQLFLSVAINQGAGIDYHVVLAQNALQHALDIPELQNELICQLIKQTSRHTGQKISTSGVQVNTKKLGKQTRIPHIPIIDCKSNPPSFTFIQGWQLLSLAVSLFVPKNSRLLWFLKLHLARSSDTKTETGKYASYCERALERTIKNGPREGKPSRMEVLSILLKNPYHHSLPHAIPVHLMNSSYQVISFDGSSTIEEFHSTLTQEIGCRDSNNGFALFSDDPIEKDLEHYLDPQAKLCDVISKWETALREKGSGKFENSRVIQVTYKNRLYFKHSVKLETEKERLLLCYQINQQIVQGRFPLSRDLALEMASLMSQIDMSDIGEKNKGTSLQAIDKFYPYRYRDVLTPEGLKELQEMLASKWALLKGRSTADCVRIYLTCARKWNYFGAALFQAKPRYLDQGMVWLAVAEEALHILDLSSMLPLARYTYSSVLTFGGLQDDFMIVVGAEDTLNPNMEQKLFAMSKPKILEITLLIADYMNALGHALPGTPQMNTLTRNGSYRSAKSKLASSTATPAHNTLNSHISHTFNSCSNTLYSTAHSTHGSDYHKNSLDRSK